MGVIAETVRTWPGAVRSDHPHVSFAAVGGQALSVTGVHQLDDELGEHSPLGAVYRLDGKVLLLGCGHDSNTSLHLAEWRQKSAPRAVKGASVRRADGTSEWISWTDVADNTDDFEQIGAAFEVAVGLSVGQVGDAEARLTPQRALVDFATDWMAEHRPRSELRRAVAGFRWVSRLLAVAYGVSVNRATRWVTENSAEHSQLYIERFRRLASEGADLAGEARMVDAMLPRASRVLDAGCGQGRVGAELAARGHQVTGVDADAGLILAARADHPGQRWVVADLVDLDLSFHGDPGPFDAAVMAGNVMLFVAQGTEERVLRRVAAHLRADGFAVIGFGADRGYELPDFDRHAAAAGLATEQRFATWDLRPWRSGSPFSVTVLRR